MEVIPDHVPPDRVVRFDFRQDPGLRTDPWRVISALHEDKPDIFYSPELGGYWVVTPAPLIEEVFRRSDLFSNRVVAIPPVPNVPTLIPNTIDPPDHAKYRKLLAQKMFSPRALAALESDARGLIRSWVTEHRPRGRCEFVADFARILPVDIFLRMMGLSTAERPRFMPWIQGVFRPESVAHSEWAFTQTATYLGEWLDARIADPALAEGGHMLPAMLEAVIEGRRLTRDEMLSIWMMLFLGGLDTVTAQMTHVMRFLADSPAHRRHLIEKPGDLQRAIEELLRRFGIANIGRIVAKDIEFHGVTMRAGDLVLCSTPIAGLDPSIYPDPQKVDFERGDPRAHWAFGSGIHLCPGAYLARLQLRIMLEELLPAFPELRIPPGSTPEAGSGGTISLLSLPLEWDPDPSGSH